MRWGFFKLKIFEGIWTSDIPGGRTRLRICPVLAAKNSSNDTMAAIAIWEHHEINLNNLFVVIFSELLKFYVRESVHKF